ncbi:MAG: MFS transporter [Caulobacteraceae bacterium]|nr:MFS transporter [Caulobacteraceae bacterium]
MAEATAAAPPLGLWTKLNYGLGATAAGVAYAALSGAVLQYYLNQVMRLPAILVGTAIMISLAADAVVDPLLGQWSDNFRSRWGRRHPFMYASAILASASFYGLWHAPQSLSGLGLLAYVLLLLVLVRISVSLFDVPNNALAPELAPDYDQRTVLSSFRFFFFVFGLASMSYLLNGVFLRKDATHPLGLLNREGYAQFGLVGALVILATILASSLGTHDRIPHLHRPPQRHVTLAQTFGEIIATLTNPSLVALLVAGVVGGAAAGMQGGLDYYFYTHLWGLAPGQLAALLPVASLGSVIAVFAAPPLSRRFGKKRTMIGLFSGSTLAGLTPMSLRLFDLMPPNGAPLTFAILLLTAVVVGTLAIMGYIIIASMVADVVEDNAVRTGVRSEGLLFATNGLVPKFTAGIGAFFAGLLVTLVHFPTHAVQGSVPAELMRRLILLYLPTYAVLVAASIAVLALYRIDRHTHEHNLERLKEMATLGVVDEPPEAEPPQTGPLAAEPGAAASA